MQEKKSERVEKVEGGGGGGGSGGALNHSPLFKSLSPPPLVLLPLSLITRRAINYRVALMEISHM